MKHNHYSIQLVNELPHGFQRNTPRQHIYTRKISDIKSPYNKIFKKSIINKIFFRSTFNQWSISHARDVTTKSEESEPVYITLDLDSMTENVLSQTFGQCLHSLNANIYVIVRKQETLTKIVKKSLHYIFYQNVYVKKLQSKYLLYISVSLEWWLTSPSGELIG